MFKRKLLALDYAQPDKFDINNETEMRNLILWLEDKKIRNLKIEDRVALRDITNPNWIKFCNQYLAELGCPYLEGCKEIVIDWLLGNAIRLKYGEDAASYRNITHKPAVNSLTGAAMSKNPLENLDFYDADFKAGVVSLAMLLKVPPHKDHIEQLKAIFILANNAFSKESLMCSSKSKYKDAEHIPLSNTELGFESGNYIVNDAAKVVRLLHLKELRDLQSEINSAIVAVQAITADPKTDSRLGVVGRNL